MFRWLLVTCLLSTSASAQMPDPPNAEAFRLCRVALIFHIDTGFWEDARYPREVAETLLEQIHFVMSEYAFGTPSGSVRQSLERVRFAERFFFDNADLVRDRGDELRTLEARERIIDGCPKVIWETVRFEIDQLMHSRNHLLGLPPPLEHGPDAGR